MNKKVIITGGAGFLGVHLARRLLKEKYEVTLYDIANLDAKDLLGKVRFIQGDIRNQSALEEAFQKQNFVVHAAAALPILRSKEEIFSINVEGTKNVLRCSLKNKIKRVVFISTTAVYGVPKHLPEREESPMSPIGFYGESKLKAEKLCLKYSSQGLSVKILRPKTFLGPERLGVFQLWFEAIYTGRGIFILGDGNNRYQLLAVSDVVDAIVKSLEKNTKNVIFNIGAKEFETWRSDLGVVIKYANSKTKIFSLPILLSQFLLSILENLNLSPISAWHYKTLPVDSYVDITKANKYLNWYPKKSNQDIFIENYKWYKENRNRIINRIGNTHRVGWNFKILNLLKM